MRNLKRALSLGLTAAMISGLMVMGSSAASYADVTSEQNQEAIEVLRTVGVMVGDDNGNFNPDQKVTRNEMAVVMSNLMEYNVASYRGTSPFTDVPSWAEPYVAACWTNGITAGYSATTYGGSDTVTTAQAALMLMKALGYFQYQSDFSNDWQLATVSQGNRIALFENVDSGVREAMTRNELAQLVLNTLKSGMVEPDDDTINVTTPDGTTVNAGKVDYVYVSSEESYAKAIKDLTGWNSTSISTAGWIVELGEYLYDGDLKMDDDTRDAFGRPATEWTLKTNEVGTYAETPLATYTTKVTKGDLWSLLGRSNVNNLGGSTELDVYANGADVGVPDKTDYFRSNSSAAAGVDDANNGVAANGVLTEVYMDNDGNVSIVYVNTYLAQANGDFRENSGTLNTVTLTNPSNFTLGTLDEEDFENLSEFVDEDYILYTVSYQGGTPTVESIAKAQIVSGTVDAYSQTESVTIGGTKYDYAKRIEGTDATGSKATEFTVGSNAAIVLDQYGYVLYVDDASLSVGNYLYVDGIIKSTGFGDDYTARVYGSDGTKRTVAIDKLYDEDAVSDGRVSSATIDANGVVDLSTVTVSGGGTIGTTLTAAGSALSGWYSYSETDGEYTLRRAETNGSKSYTGTSSEKKVMVNGNVLFLDDASVRGDNNTIFVIVDTDGDVTVYVGINNAPDISLTDTASGETLTAHWMLSKDTAGNYASLVFVDASDLDATDVSISGGNEESLMFVLNRKTTYIDRPTGETIETWNVVLNGEVTTVDAKRNALSAYTMYYKVTQDSNGYYKATAFPGIMNDYTANQLLISNHDEIDFSSGAVALGAYTYSITDDTQIVLVLNDTVNDSNPSGTKNSGNYLGSVVSGNTVVMTDPDAKHEVLTGLNGRGLENAVRGYYVDATFYGVKTSSSDQLKTLYVVVTNVADAP